MTTGAFSTWPPSNGCTSPDCSRIGLYWVCQPDQVRWLVCDLHVMPLIQHVHRIFGTRAEVVVIGAEL